MVIKEDQFQWFIDFLIKKSASLNKSALLNKFSGSGIAALLANKCANEPNYQLANEPHKPTIKKFKKRTVYSYFRDNILGVDLADMQSLSQYNKGVKHLLCAIDLFSKQRGLFLKKIKKELVQSMHLMK